MAGKLCDFGERLVLHTALANMPPLTLHLIKQAFTPSDTQTLDVITEADYDGYTALALDYDALQAGNPGGRAVADFVTLVFTCTGPTLANLIYGYWVEDAAHNVVWIERFVGNPRPMMANGQQVTITPHLRLFSPN